MRLVALLAAALALAGCADPLDASGTTSSTTSPYAGFAQAQVRSLTPEQAEVLRTGAGGGYALAAELNGYAGPKHVLDMAAELGLTDAQLEAVRQVRAQVLADAVAQGAVVLEAYAALDAGFRNGTADAAWLAQASADVGAQEARLRAIHLQAHIDLTGVLDAGQQARYAELRGYAADGADGHAGHDDHDGSHA